MNWEDTRILKDEVAFDKKDMNEQAEASFKAGYEEGRKGCPALEVQGQVYLEGKKAGIREVVEWITAEDLDTELPWNMWEAKLKEWGIEEGNENSTL